MKTVKIFVSYARKNYRWCDESDPHSIIPFIRDSLKWRNIQLWYDQDLSSLPGVDYEKKIFKEIEDSRIAILLLSRDFINSDFIMNKELPKIKERLEQGLLEIIPILVEPWSVPVNHPAYWLTKNQIIPSNSVPLSNFIGSDKSFLNKREHILTSIERIITTLDKGQEESSSSTRVTSTGTKGPKGPSPLKKFIMKNAPYFIIAAIVIGLLAIFNNKWWPFGSEADKPGTEIGIEESDLPLTAEEFRAKVLTSVLLLRSDPIENFVKQESKFSDLIDIEKKHDYYSKNLKTETAILYRVFGSGKMISIQDSKTLPATNFKTYFPYLERSMKLDKEVWKEDAAKDGYNFLVKMGRGLEDSDFKDVKFVRDYLQNLIIILMYSASEEEIATAVAEFIDDGLDPLTEVIAFFYKYPIGDTNYQLTIEAIKMLLIGMGSELLGPEIVPKNKGNYHIKYWLFDSQGTKKFLIWEVDWNERTVSPFNADAKMFTDAIKNKK